MSNIAATVTEPNGDVYYVSFVAGSDLVNPSIKEDIFNSIG